MKKILTILFILTAGFVQAQIPKTDTLKVLYLTAKKSVKYNTYTAAVLKGFVVYQNDSATNGIELIRYLDDKKQLLKNDIIFSFTPIK